METLTVAVDDRLAVVTVGRPEVRDALTRQVLAELRDVLADLRERDDVGLVAVNGFALGGGCELAMACDIRIASGNARFGLPETTLSVLPGAGGTQRLARLIGTGRAIEMILTGRFVDATEGHAIGLVTAVVPADSLPAELRRLADQRTGQVIEQLAQALLYTTADKTEGTSAFLEKRSPEFKGV
jgi:enoyl-CoA hydratase/carnithine racemase